MIEKTNLTVNNKNELLKLLNDLYNQLQNEHLSEFMNPLMDKLEKLNK